MKNLIKYNLFEIIVTIIVTILVFGIAIFGTIEMLNINESTIAKIFGITILCGGSITLWVIFNDYLWEWF